MNRWKNRNSLLNRKVIWLLALLGLVLHTLAVTPTTRDCALGDASVGSLCPCAFCSDPTFKGGTLAQCSSLALTRVNASCFPPNTTTLVLDSNPLKLENAMFAGLKKLRCLSLRACGVHGIAEGTFQGLERLEILDLEENRLDLVNGVDSLTFRNLTALKTLKLAFNNNQISKGSYPEGLLHGLKRIENLSLDTVLGPLNISGLFRDCRNLQELSLSGGANSLQNESFSGFQNISLTSLHFRYISLKNGIEVNSFQYLKKLRNLSMKGTSQGVRESLNSLMPFQHKNLTSLTFENVAMFNIHTGMPGYTHLSQDMMAYLSKVCVKHFTMSNSYIYFVESNIFARSILTSCLETFNMRGNPLMGDVRVLIRFSQLQKLTSFIISHCFGGLPGEYQDGLSLDGGGCGPTSNTVTPTSVSSRRQPPGVNSTLLSRRGIGSQTDYFSLQDERGTTHASNNLPEKVIVPLPPNLEELQYSWCGKKFTDFNRPFIFGNAQNLKRLDLSGNGISLFTSQLEGLTNISYLDLSYNNGTIMSISFLDSFPSIRHLRLSGMYLNFSQTLHFGWRLFLYLTHLETLDLSFNSLNSLHENSFKHSPSLESLNMAGNKFDTIPKSVLSLRSLRQLNMTFNSITSLGSEERHFLDTHVKRVPSFSLQLAGNFLACDCSSLQFMVWLQNSSVDLDSNRNYACMDERAKVSNTRKQMKRLDQLWRVCVGPRAFYLSLVLLVAMLLSYFVIFIFFHYQTLIVTAIMRALFSRNFTIKTRQDYKHGVFIVYSDQDYKFACFDLRRFLEARLKVSTYLKDRDLLPAVDVAESIMETVKASWRVLFIISRQFLRCQQWGHFTIDAALYSDDPLNPRKIILLVERDALAWVPRSLLRAVPEDQILDLEKPFRLGRHEKEILKNAIY